MEIALHAHPAFPPRAIHAVSVTVERRSVPLVALRYTVLGRIGELRLPPPAPPGRAGDLWQTTCFESFLRPTEGACYLEFNFSPSGRWAAYDFTAYRAGMVQLALCSPPRIEVTQTPDRLDVDVLLSIDLGPGGHALSLAAVIEEEDGRKSFWAASHAADAPDFHDPSCFVLELPAAPRA